MNTNSDLDNPVFRRFLERQTEEGLALARSSDLLELHVHPAPPPHFLAEFRCKSLVREGGGEIREAASFLVGIWFPPDYLRRADPFQIVRLFTPHVWHPNVSREMPLICLGRLTPGTTLVDLLFQVYDILTYQKYNPREDDSLNREACAWARANQERFPIDRRPLKRVSRPEMEPQP